MSEGINSRGKGREAAYSREVRVPFLARPIERCLAASASSWLPAKLQMRVERTRQGVLTAGAGFMEGKGCSRQRTTGSAASCSA